MLKVLLLLISCLQARSIKIIRLMEVLINLDDGRYCFIGVKSVHLNFIMFEEF
jgi:hypothetical protein